MEEIPKISLNEVMNKKKDDSFSDFKKMMYSHKFDFDEQDEQGKTLLINLIESQSPTEFVWFCLEYFSDPNIQDKIGNTALHYAFNSPNKQYIYILLLFNADAKIKNNEEKEAFEMIGSGMMKPEDAFKIFDITNSIKLDFARLTRQRRELAREIFSFIEGGEDIRGVTPQKLTFFNMWLNNDSIADATNDANLFFDESKLPTTTLEFYFEEWIISLTKISKNYGLNKLDEFFELYKKVLATGKKLQTDF